MSEPTVNGITIIGQKEVARRLDISVRTLLRWRSMIDFPKPIKIGVGKIGFIESDIDRWITTQKPGFPDGVRI